MLPLVVPILAQTIGFGVGDRVEARALTSPDDNRLEAEMRGFAGVSFDSKPLTLNLRYSPKVVVTPLEEPEREATLVNDIGADAEIRVPLYEARRTTLTLRQRGDYNQTNYLVSALGSPAPQGTAPPTPPAGAPGEAPAETPGQGAAEVPATNTTVRFAESRSELVLEHLAGRRSRLEVTTSYIVNSGVGAESRQIFPLFHGPEIESTLAHRVGRRDTLTTDVTGRYAMVETGERFWYADATEEWSHDFSRRTRTSLEGGVAYARLTDETGPDEGIYPVGGAALEYSAPFKRGRLVLRVDVSYEPTVDRSSIELDRRMLANFSASWTRRRLELHAFSTGIFSLRPESPGSLSSLTAEAGVRYDLGAGFGFDSGVRAAWQTFEGTQIIPATAGVYVAIEWGARFL